MTRIHGMTTNDQAAFRRALILAALSGVAAEWRRDSGSIAHDAVAIADAVLRKLAAESTEPPLHNCIPNCIHCGEPIAGTVIGAGDGTGQKFAHPVCYRVDRLITYWLERAWIPPTAPMIAKLREALSSEHGARGRTP